MVKDIKSVVHAAAFGVLEAMLNLVGRELTYFQIRGGKMGLLHMQVTNLTSRKSTQASLLWCRESLWDCNPWFRNSAFEVQSIIERRRFSCRSWYPRVFKPWYWVIDTNAQVHKETHGDFVRIQISELLARFKEALLDWLYPNDFRIMHYALRARRAKGSGEWFVNELNQWLKAGSSDVLICHGMRTLLLFMHLTS